jgi:hypothetical protein
LGRPAALSRAGRPPAFLVGVSATAILSLVVTGFVCAQGIRDRTRPKTDRSTAVSKSQAEELTLTLTDVSVRPIQVWVRTGGPIDPARKTVKAVLSADEAAFVRTGQRVRAFPPESKSSISQARISRIAPQSDGVVVEATLAGVGREAVRYYVLEIVADAGESLSVPNEAIIATERAHLVYVQQEGRYLPREIQVGVQGELYTQVLGGLQAGEQVVTVGSFFIDAEHKLEGP